MTDRKGGVALVLVSHSKGLAEGVAALAREVGGDAVKIVCAAGAGADGSELGTNATRILDAIVEADNPAGTVVFMDLGSAILATEMALDLADPQMRERVLLSAAPFVEGVMAAAVASAAGASRQAIVDEASRALQPKLSQLGIEADHPTDAAATPSSVRREPDAVAEARILDPHGLHARPAGRVAALAGRFRADIAIADADNGKGPVDAGSLIRLMSLAALAGHRLVISATGPDAKEAASALQAQIEGFAGEASTAATATASATSHLPVPVSPGIAIGPLVVAETCSPAIPKDTVRDTAAEVVRLQAAVGAVIAELETRQSSRAAADIAAVQVNLLRDPVLAETAQSLIVREKLNAAAAFARAADGAARMLQALDDPYLRARQADLSGVARAVIGRLLGVPAPRLPDGPPAILLADDLAPSQVLALDRTRLCGVLDRRGGPTSHAAILLRTFGIPALAGVDALVPAAGADFAAFDGVSGEIVFDPSCEEIAGFSSRRDAWDARQRSAALDAGCARTRDGVAIELWANVAGPAEAVAAAAAGAYGIGLLRTEMMFLDRETAPGEAEQAAGLRDVFAAVTGRPIVVRTLDAGGDKPIPYMDMPREANPYLGVRGLRLSLRHMALFETQLRAILRAAEGHDVRILLPMVTEPEEVAAARAALERAHAALAREGIACRWPVPLGVMIEVPAAALNAGQLARVADFFSIGTNDLTQYALAAERGNPALGRFSDAAHPAVLGLIARAVAGANAGRIPISVCGEAAADAAAALLLVGLGIRRLSMAPVALRPISARLAEVECGAVTRAAQAALEVDTARQARERLEAT
jgi:phosphocarrier protein FPr